MRHLGVKEGSIGKAVQAVSSAGMLSVQTEADWEGRVLSVGNADAGGVYVSLSQALVAQK